MLLNSALLFFNFISETERNLKQLLLLIFWDHLSRYNWSNNCMFNLVLGNSIYNATSETRQILTLVS